MTDKWRSKIEALLRLSEDSGATPAEKSRAKEKLQELIRNHPEAYEQPNFKERIDRIFTGRDFLELKAMGDTDGSWTASTLEGALQMMVADYANRLARKKRKRLSVPKLPDNVDNALNMLDATIKMLERSKNG